jgi:DNA-binding beta-propeller fold protein YncE
MSRWKFFSILTLVLALGALGCGSSATSTVTITLNQSAVSVITNTTFQFADFVTGNSNQSATWTIACAVVGSQTATGCGTIDSSTGLYTAPATIPTLTISGTVTPEPSATVTATSVADTTKTAIATITIITGISIAITPSGATIGTGEHFTFAATVNNPGCNTTSNTTCLNVTWSVPAATSTTNFGSIDANGTYTAPTTAPSPSSVTITATSVADTSITATATVVVETASNPTITSVSPPTAALGSLFEDVYITGTNFLSTSIVYVNGILINPTEISADSTSVIRARLTPNFLVPPTLPPSGILSFSVSQQVGTPQSCTDPTQCQVLVTPVRPVIVGPSPDSVPQSQNGSAVQSFNVNGGFFGTSSSPTVSATYDGQAHASAVTSNTSRQLTVTLGGNSNSQDFTLAGLHQITIRSNGDPTKFASANLAVQPDANANPPTPIGSPLAVGKTPNDVAINPATGMAVVANSGSNDVTLIDLSGSSPSVLLASLCTGAVGTASAPCTTTSGPMGVAVAHLINPSKDIALVANTATKTLSEIDLNARTVTWVSQPLVDPPISVGINPVTGRALVAMNTRPYGLIVDLTSQSSPFIVGPVSIVTGLNTHVAVEPHLNWALATPGGTGTVSIVDLNRQTTNNIVSISRTTNVVTVTVQASTASVPQSPLSLVAGESIQIQNVSVGGDASFNGVYQVAAPGPGATAFSYTQTGNALPDVASTTTTGTVNYSKPVATLSATGTGVQGIGINTETETAIMADPTASGGLSIFSLIDQSSQSFALTNSSNSTEFGPSFATYNQLTNTAYVLNTNNSTLSVIDPTTPKRLPSPTTTFATGQKPVALAVDPPSNRLIVVNQTDNTVWVYSLGSLSTIRPIAITETNPKIFTATSTLNSGPAPSALTLTVLGKGLTCTNNSTSLTVRLDGTPLSTACAFGSGDRALTATVPPSLLSHARRFTLDVVDGSGNVSNASDFTVEQSIDVTGCSATPFPSGVAIDAVQNIAAVTLAGCNEVAFINLTNGTGQSVSVGSTPLGVAVIPRLHEAIVANNGSGNASIVDELGASVTNTITTAQGSTGVAADQNTGEAAVANTLANTVSVIDTIGGSATNTISTDQRPVAVGFNYLDHEVAIAADSNSSSQGSVAFADAGSGTTITSIGVSLPTSVVFDPVTGDLGGDCSSTPTSSNNTGCFLINSSTGNNLTIYDPVAQFESTFRIGINPTALAYNYLTGTVVSTNTISHTVTVGDFIAQRIRAVLTLPPAPAASILDQQGVLQFAVDIQPLTNLAVIADTANGRVLFVPVPR